MLEPEYWLSPDARAGCNDETMLVPVPADSLATHTAIIAQSGSGKSFFLGRLLEEILINTKCRCIIIDPNSDFKKVYEVEDAALWKKARYDHKKHCGRLPHEASRAIFERDWSRVSITVKTDRYRRPVDERIELWWPSLPVEFLAEDLEPSARSDLYHIHVFVRFVELLLRMRPSKNKTCADRIFEAEGLFKVGRKNEATLKAELANRFRTDHFNDSSMKRALELLLPGRSRWIFSLPHIRPGEILKGLVQQRLEFLASAPRYVTPQVEKFYFGRFREYHASGVLRDNVQNTMTSSRLEVVDLPSLTDHHVRLLAVSTVVEDQWQRALREWSRAISSQLDRRVPTFIVVDEAHNLIPADPLRSKPEITLRQQFRTIIAEGRKYGLFLILVTQRPDKIDPLVLSECENKALMKLGSMSTLNLTKKLLGLEDTPSRVLRKCLEFEIGRALLIGPWAQQGPTFLYSAARRTVEGGRNLRPKYWASRADSRP